MFTFSLLKIQDVVNKPNSSEMENEKNEDSSIKLFDSHAYRIARFDNNRVYFTNPWEDTVELSLSADEFKNLKGLRLEKLELR